MQHKNDSAAYYIELRASLDELNCQWLIDAGVFLGEWQGLINRFNRYLGILDASGKLGILDASGKYKLSWRGSERTMAISEPLQGRYYIPCLDYCEYFRRAFKITEDNKKAELLLRWGSVDLACNDSIARIHFDSCYYYLRQYNSLDNSISYSVLSELGEYYYVLHEYDKTLEVEKKALAISQKTIHDSIFLHANYWYIGLCYEKLNDYKQAIINCEYAISLLLKYYDEYDTQMWWYYDKIGSIYYNNQDFEKGSYYKEKVPKIEDKDLYYYKEKLEKYRESISDEAKEQAPKFGVY